LAKLNVLAEALRKIAFRRLFPLYKRKPAFRGYCDLGGSGLILILLCTSGLLSLKDSWNLRKSSIRFLSLSKMPSKVFFEHNLALDIKYANYPHMKLKLIILDAQ